MPTPLILSLSKDAPPPCLTSTPTPLMLSLSKHGRSGWVWETSFDRLRMSGGRRPRVGLRISLCLKPALALSALAIALTSPALAKPQPKPGFEPTLPAPLEPTRAPDGGIFNASTGYAALIEGNRARRVGDPVTVLLLESITTSKSAASRTQRNGNFSVTPPTEGPLSFLDPNALKASGQSSFNGQGNAGQTSAIQGELSVTIAEVRPNGTALLRGEKRMLLSQGDEWIQFSGIVRLADIGEANRVASTRIADARIEYSGKGSVQRASREGWLLRFFNIVSPF